MSYRSGFIAIVGPPNVGKSTLMNRLVGKKLAIVSPKPQTTRTRIVGVCHGDGFQMVVMDTPGIHRTRSVLHESMVKSALAAFHEVDRLLLMIDARTPYERQASLIVHTLKEMKKPCVLVINKIDLGPKEILLPITDHWRRQYPFDAIIPVSALLGDGVETLMARLTSSLTPGPRFFPPDVDTDQSEPALAAEVIREQIYYHIRDELPYSAAVTVDAMEEVPGKDLLLISARIHVETDSQKKIFLGARGRMIKKIGRSARLAMEKLFGVRIYLKLTVRVEKNWSRDSRALRRLGY